MSNFIKKNYKTILIALIGFLFLALWASWRNSKESAEQIGNFEECVFYYEIISDHPATCLTPNGEFFVEYSLSDPRAEIDLDKEWTVNEGDLFISGEITGQWFFEASFVAEIWDESGRKISQGLAEAKDNWMTSELVLFEINFEISSAWKEEKAILVLRKDNPSGLPEHEDALALPIRLNHVSDGTE